MGPSTSGANLVGHKHSASGAVPGSTRHGHNPNKLASADDFPPGHFDEPHSDDHIPLVPPHINTSQLSPMRVDSTILKGIMQPVASPISSSISQNPLLQPAAGNEHMPFPCHPSSSLRTQDSHTAQAVMDSMFPIGNGFQAPGYAPVGGITYSVHSPLLG